MKINKNILNIPPYISTSWNNISSLHMEDDYLIVTLKNNLKIEIPDLQKPILEAIFNAHSQHLETPNTKTSLDFGLPMFGNSSTMESFTSAMQHNPSQKDIPDIPADILKKITSVAKIFSDETNMDLPKPEANCNCMHCQIARALQISSGINPENLDEDVSAEDLKFRLWDIKEEDKKLYTVTNPLDNNEQYRVFLGEPIGCTCGKKNCEHIKAVLNT